MLEFIFDESHRIEMLSSRNYVILVNCRIVFVVSPINKCAFKQLPPRSPRVQLPYNTVRQARQHNKSWSNYETSDIQSSDR